jgi:hypothetical protein
MIPYELIIPSASRPHLLLRVLRSLAAYLDHPPVRVLVHDDAVFPDKQQHVEDVVRDTVEHHFGDVPVWFQADNPPLFHGPSLQRLLAAVETPYVLYSQDDHQAVRPIPVRAALAVLHAHGLNQIRFNKRDTLDKKGREGAEFFKKEFSFGPLTICCAADHWYFQTGIWRVAAIKPVVDWWAGPLGAQHGHFSEHMEVKVNQVFNGQWRSKHPPFPSEVPELDDPTRWAEPAIRATVHKTFIWGPVGEPAYVQHLGTDPKDWALIRGNRDQPGTKGA